MRPRSSRSTSRCSERPPDPCPCSSGTWRRAGWTRRPRPSASPSPSTSRTASTRSRWRTRHPHERTNLGLHELGPIRGDAELQPTLRPVMRRRLEILDVGDATELIVVHGSGARFTVPFDEIVQDDATGLERGVVHAFAALRPPWPVARATLAIPGAGPDRPRAPEGRTRPPRPAAPLSAARGVTPAPRVHRRRAWARISPWPLLPSARP